MSSDPTGFGDDPDSIGKYEIVGRIGEGGFGVVWEGKDPYLERRVAVKTCTAEESELRDRFFREAEIAGNLRHPNIVTVHDFGTQEGVPYLVQEYLSGEDVDQLIARRAPLTVRRRLEVLRDVARGLEHAHAEGVVHRDVKPANIRITDKGRVKIMDFGVAKLLNVASRLTKTGMALGTAAYLPPEQIRGNAVDHRADIFSYGVMAFELLTYQRPFGGRSISALFFEIIHQATPRLAERWPECPPALDRLVGRCLEKEPGDRYDGFGALLGDLDAILSGLDLSTASQDGSTQMLLEQRSAKDASDIFTRVTAMVETGDFDGAARAVEEASQEMSPSRAHALEDSFEAAMADRLLAQAAAAKESGDLDGALTALQELRSRWPGHEVARIREREVRTEIDDETRRAQLATDCASLRALLARGDVERVTLFLETARATYGDAPELAAIEEEVERARAAASAGEESEAEPEPSVDDATRMLTADEMVAMGARPQPSAPSAPDTPPPTAAPKAAPRPPSEPDVRIPPAASHAAARSVGPPWRLLAVVGVVFLLFLLVAWWSLSVRGGDGPGADVEPTTEASLFADEANGEPSLVEPVPDENLPTEPGGDVVTGSDAPLYRTGQEGVTPATLETFPDLSLESPSGGPGQVLLYVLVDETGSVTTVRTLEDGGLPPRTLAIVHEAAAQARFQPATRDGTPGQQWTTVRVPLGGG